MTTEPRLPPSCAQRFRPTRVLASGGFGTVWLAQQLSLDRPVAVKVLHGEVLANDTAVQRFLKEAQVTAQLTHPNIVVLVDHDVEGGVPWIAYEYVPGRSLRKRIEEGALPWQDACVVAIQIASALEVAHARGVLHRDIKPDNVLEASLGSYKVADFGIARTESGKTLTAQGEIVGTPGYLSPVQLRGEIPGPESDIYALGITLYEMLTGELPFQDDNIVRLLQRHIMEEPARPSAKVEGVPRELDSIVLRALAKRRQDRFATAAEMRAALERVATGSTTPRGDSSGRGPRPPRDVSGRTTRPAPARPVVSRATAVVLPPLRSRLALGGAIALVGGVVLVTLAWRRAPVSSSSPRASSSPASIRSVAPAERPRITDLHLAVSDGSVTVALRRDRPGELVVTVRPRGASPDRRTHTLPASPLRSRFVVTKLKPETDHELTIETTTGARVAEGVRFRTSTRQEGEHARSLTARVLAKQSDLFKTVVRRALDPALEPILVQAIREAPQDDDVLAELADLVRDLRSDAAAGALAQRLPGTTRPALRGSLIGAMLYCEWPEAADLALAELGRGAAEGREKLVAPLGGYPSAPLAERFATSLDSVPPQSTNHAGVALARMDPGIAAKWLEKWLPIPRTSPRYALAIAAQQGLARLEPRLARPILQRALEGAHADTSSNAILAAVRAGYRDLIGARHARFPDDRLALRAAALFGFESTVPHLLRVARGTGTAALGAAAALAGPTGPARAIALKELLASADVRIAGAAAWAAGAARVEELLPGLRGLSPGRDALGLSLWARARLNDRTAAEPIQSGLASLSADAFLRGPERPQLSRARILAVAAAELGLRDAALLIRAFPRGRDGIDGCLEQVLEVLEGRSKATFHLLHPAALLLKTGYSLTPGQSLSASVWALEPDRRGVDAVAGKISGDAFLYVGDSSAWKLKNAPHSFFAMVPVEPLICRDSLVDLEPDGEIGVASVVVLE